MRHPGRKVLLSIQGGHFSFEAFKEGKLVMGNSIMRHRGRKNLLSIQGGHFLFKAFREGKFILMYPQKEKG